jgi:hypothetical protein
MPPPVGSIRLLSRARAEFDSAVTAHDLSQLATHRDLSVLQCAAPVPDSVWELLNTSFFAARPDVELRMFAHYSTGCDLRGARRLTNVRRFAADCLSTAKDVEAIAEIPMLESLAVGIFDLRSFDFLERVSPTLTSLALGGTRSKAPSLAALSRFRSLKKLYLERHTKDIEVIRGLVDLEELTLRSITTPNLDYLEPLRRLWSLEIKLGGIKSFTGVEGKSSIKYLELWQIRELPDAGVVSTLPGLQNLFLQSLRAHHIVSVRRRQRRTPTRHRAVSEDAA